MTRVTNSRLRPPRFGDARSPSASRTTQGAQQSTMPRYLSHSRLALTGLAQRAMDPQGADPAHAFTPPARVHPHPHSATNRLASPCRRHVFVALPEAKHRCAALEGDLCIFLTIGVSIKTRCEGGGDSFVYLSRRLSSIVSAGALAPGHSSKLYMRKR